MKLALPSSFDSTEQLIEILSDQVRPLIFSPFFSCGVPRTLSSYATVLLVSSPRTNTPISCLFSPQPFRSARPSGSGCTKKPSPSSSVSAQPLTFLN
jgi:hypothetical protein